MYDLTVGGLAIRGEYTTFSPFTDLIYRWLGGIMKICKAEDCGKDAIAKGFCNKHYRRFKKHGDPLYKKELRICSIEGCGRKHEGLGYCNRHYQQYLRFDDPLHQERERHGMSYTSEYGAWDSMKKRCFNKNNKAYHRYGGRNITICDRWYHSFMAFYADMGSKPFPKAQIDRIDNDGNYEPGNCRWTTQTENIRNSTRVKLSVPKVRKIRKLYEEGNMSQKEISLIYGVSGANICEIVNNKIWL